MSEIFIFDVNRQLSCKKLKFYEQRKMRISFADQRLLQTSSNLYKKTPSFFPGVLGPKLMKVKTLYGILKYMYLINPLNGVLVSLL